MSLTILRTARLLRQNAASQLETRACMCSIVKPLHGQDNNAPFGQEDLGKLVGTSEVPKYVEKKKMISRAMQLYLAKRQNEVGFKQKNVQEMKLGERHLANIMGVDVNDLGPDDIRRAISYILPSGLHSRLARPTMELPINMLMDSKAESFSASGKPDHYLFYTLKPSYFQLMHEMAMLFEDIRKEQTLYQGKPLIPSTTEEKKQKEEFDRMVRRGLVAFDKLKELFPSERLSVADEIKFNNLLERLVQEPLAYKRMSFFDQFPKPDRAAERNVIRENELFEEDGRLVAYAEGGRKTIKANVKVMSNGTGELTINNEDILFFDDIAHRQAVLFPMKFLGVLGKYDIEAEVTTSSIPNQNCDSSQAGALRLAIARAIVKYSTDEADVFRMEKAGLLTRDPRMRERKKPGQEGARRKFTWKAR